MKDPAEASRSFYKPMITTTPILGALLLVTIALIIVTEIACRQIPNHPGIGKLGETATDILSESLGGTALLPRQNVVTNIGLSVPSSRLDLRSAAASTNGTIVVTSDPPIMSGPSLPSSTLFSITILTTTNPGLSLGDGSLSTPSSTPFTTTISATTTNPGLALGGGSLSAPSSVPGSINTNSVSSTDRLVTPSLFVPSSSKFSGMGSNPSSILRISQTWSQSQYSTSSLPAQTTPPTLVLVDGSISTQSSAGIALDTNGSILPILTTTAGQTFIVTPVFTTFGSQILEETPALTVISGNTYVTLVGTYSAQSTSVASGNKAATATAPVNPISTFINSTGTYLTWSNGGITLYPQITLQQYIYVGFVPLILAVIYSIPWHILDSTIREIEPFYQFYRPQGALGRDSLCLNYATSFLAVIPFKALYRGHFIPLWSSLISLSTLILAPLSSEAFFVSLGTGCYTNTEELCHASWGVYPIFARLIQAIFAFVAGLLLLLIIGSFSRSSGVYSEPLSIVGLGVLLSKSPLLNLLLDLDSKISNKELRDALEGRIFKLSWFTVEDGQQSYGIMPLDNGSEENFASFRKKPRYKPIPMNEMGLSDQRQKRGQAKKATGKSLIWEVIEEKALFVASFLIFGGLLTMISYYHWTGQNTAGQSTAFETFMDSRGFGVRFMMSIVGVAVKILWSMIDADNRKYAPYTRLIQGSSKAEDSILLPVWQSPFSAVIPSLRRRHYLTAVISAIALPTEFLPLFLANIPFSFGTTKLAYTISNYFSMLILISMIITTIVLIFKKPSRIGILPRKLDTLASIAVYLAGKGDGCLLDSLIELGVTKREERDATIRNLEVVYSMGFVDDIREELRIDDDARIVSSI